MTPQNQSFTQMDRVDEILNRICELNPTESSRFLRKLVKKIGNRTTEMNFLRSLVQAVPSGSNLDRLPSEVFSAVLTNLDPKTLGRLAGTCKKISRTILNDHRPWEIIFTNEYEFGKISQVTKLFQNQIIESIRCASNSLTFNANANVDFNILPYTSAFFYESRLQRNWAKVIPGEKPIDFECHGSHVVTCMEIDPKGRYILTGSDDGTVRLWSVLEEPRELLIFNGHLGGVWALKVDWDRGILVTGSTDRTLILWDLHSGERLRHLLGHTSTVRCVELCDDLIVSGSRDGTLRVWNINNGECIHVLQGHTASVRCLSIGSEGGTVISGSYDNTCKLWKLSSGECLQTFIGHHNKVYAVTSTPEHVYSGSLDGTVKIWDSENGQCLKSVTGHRSLVGLVLSKPKLLTGIVVTGSTDGSLQVIKHSVSDSDTIFTFDSTVLPSAHPSSITSLDFNRNFLVTGSEGVVRLWSLEGGKSEPKLLANLIESLDMVWRVGVTDHLASVAYQFQGQTRLAVFNFAPQPQQVLIEMRAFKNISNLHSSSLKNIQNQNKFVYNSNTSDSNNVTPNNYNHNHRHGHGHGHGESFNSLTNSSVDFNNSTACNYPPQPQLTQSIQSHQNHHTYQHQTRHQYNVQNQNYNGNNDTFFSNFNNNNSNTDNNINNYRLHLNSHSHIDHPELLVLGMASQSLVEHADDLIFTD